jgi:hypothetical protein
MANPVFRVELRDGEIVINMPGTNYKGDISKVGGRPGFALPRPSAGMRFLSELASSRTISRESSAGLFKGQPEDQPSEITFQRLGIIAWEPYPSR